jgi:Thioredoxin-like domain
MAQSPHGAIAGQDDPMDLLVSVMRTGMRAFRHPLRFLLAVAASLGAASAGAQAMELIMFESPSCGVCKVFKREVLPIYAASPAGKVFPLWVVEMGSKLSFKINQPVTFTPTFIWVDNGVEVGRFSGYFSKEKFFSIVNKAASSQNYKNGGRQRTSALP